MKPFVTQIKCLNKACESKDYKRNCKMKKLPVPIKFIRNKKQPEQWLCSETTNQITIVCLFVKALESLTCFLMSQP